MLEVRRAVPARRPRGDWAASDQLQRRTTSPDNAVRFLDEFGRIDVRDLAGLGRFLTGRGAGDF